MFRSSSARKLVLACAGLLAMISGPLAAQAQGPQGAAGQPRIVPRRAAPAQSQPAATAPFRLTAEQQKHLDDVLNYWEYRSSQVKTYECSFIRWEYDPVFGPKNPDQAKSISRGIIRYAAPDKGLFRVESTAQYEAPQQPGGQPTYAQNQVEHGEHWVCDGQSVYEFHAQTKQLIETQLPPQLQGKAITDGPLPFLFGAKAARLKQRYWIREKTPPAGAREFWLEAYPKTREDAANFQRVEIILDDQFLPTALQLFPPNYDPQANPGRTAYKFADRKVNDLVDQVQGFMNSFVRPRLPAGWTRHVEPYGEPSEPEPARVAPAPPRAQHAVKPSRNQRR